MIRKSSFAAAILVFLGSGPARAMSYQQWTNCIITPYAYCPLDPGTHTVSSQLQPATGVTMEGLGASMYDTVLKRPDGTTYALMYVYAGRSVTIRNLVFDGNRYSFQNHQDGCNSVAGSSCGPPGGYGCTRTNWNVYELDVAGSATIDRVNFWNSPGASLQMDSGTLMNSGIFYSRSTGAIILGSATIFLTSFDHNGTAGVNFFGSNGNGKTVRASMFTLNRYEMSDGVAGVNRLHANEVTRNTGGGVVAHSVIGLEISGYNKVQCGYCYPRYTHSNTESGIGILTQSGYGVSVGVTLDSVLSRWNSGHAVFVSHPTYGTGWVGNHCLQAPFNPPYTTSTALTNPTPSNYSTCP